MLKMTKNTIFPCDYAFGFQNCYTFFKSILKSNSNQKCTPKKDVVDTIFSVEVIKYRVPINLGLERYHLLFLAWWIWGEVPLPCWYIKNILPLWNKIQMSWYILHISVLVKKGMPSPLHPPKVYYVCYSYLEFKYNTLLWSNRSKISSM